MFRTSALTLSATLLLGSALAQTHAAGPFVWPAAWSATPAGQAKRGGELRNYEISDYKTFNPFTSAEADSIPLIAAGSSGLMVQDPRTDQFLPYMAAAAPRISNGGKTYVFTIRRGMKFSDGQEITADDWVTTAKIHMDPKVGSNVHDNFFVAGKPVTVKKLGTYQVQITFPSTVATALVKASYTPWPDHVFGPAYARGGADAIKKMWGLNTPVKNFVTPGPWMLSSYQPGERTVFARNPFFGEWNKDSAGQPLPYLDRYSIRIVKDLNAALAAYLAGQIDFGPAANADQLAQIKKAITAGQLRAKLFPNIGPTAASQWIVWNWNSKDPAKQALFRDKRFRHAMSMLTDRDAMVKLVFGGIGTPTYTSVYPVFSKFIPKDLEVYRYDPAGAEKLLTAMGYAKKDSAGYRVNAAGKRLEFNLLTNTGNNLNEQMGRIFVDSAKKAGVKVNFQAVDFNSLVDQLLASGTKDRKFDAILLGLSGGDNIWPFGPNVTPCEGNLHMWNTSGRCLTPEETQMTKLFYQGQAETDAARRQQIGQQLVRVESELQPVVYLAGPAYNVTYNERVGGEMPRTLWNAYYGSRFLPLTYVK